MEETSKQFKRLFIAIRINPDSSFLNWYKQLKESLKKEDIRWTRLENLHLTLLFLGDTNVELIPAIIAALKRAVASQRSFRFYLTGIGVFRSLRYPKIFWIGIKETEKLKLIKFNIDNQLKSLLSMKESDSFKPHLTLGRMRRIYDPDLLKNLISKYSDHEFMEVEVNEIIFYESILKKSGPVYEVIETIPLPDQI
jgi:RNA 2',3'-cyclic 3'-phosphodiesterase